MKKKQEPILNHQTMKFEDWKHKSWRGIAELAIAVSTEYPYNLGPEWRLK